MEITFNKEEKVYKHNDEVKCIVCYINAKEKHFVQQIFCSESTVLWHC